MELCENHQPDQQDLTRNRIALALVGFISLRSIRGTHRMH